jgi:acetylornithine deacetylase/succinyl-diaminopimelate desuccinylase-like protein
MRKSRVWAISNRFAAAALLFLPATILAAGQQFQPLEVQKAAQASFPEFLAFLSLANDAVSPADIQKNALWLEAAFQKRGFQTRQLPNRGKPLVFAEYPGKIENAKTVLFYMHFDGQPSCRRSGRRKARGYPSSSG